MQRLDINSSSVDGQNDGLRDVGSMMFHETIPVSCISCEYNWERKKSIQHSLVLYKGQPLLCRPENLVTRIFHYDSCGSYSMKLEHNIDDASYHSKHVLATNFTTSLDYSEFTINDTISNSLSIHRSHRIVLSRGQVTCNSPFLNTYGKAFNLFPCSSYTIRVTPLASVNVLTEFSQEVNFTTIYHREGI